MTRRLAKKIIRRIHRGDDVGYTMDQRYAAGQRMWRAFKRVRRVTVTTIAGAFIGAWVA